MPNPVFTHGKSALILLNEFDLSQYFNEIGPSGMTDMHDLTTFGNDDKVFQPGIGSGSIDIMGFFSSSLVVGYPESVFAALEGATTLPLLSAAPEGFAVGKRVYLLQAHQTKHELGTKIDAFSVNKASFQSNDGYDFGISLHSHLAAETASGNSASVDNLVATANGGVAFLHVPSASGSSPTLQVKLQHSVDNSVWADLATFITTAAATKERILIAAGTTVRRYTRSLWTIGGSGPSFAFALGFARR